MLDNPKFAQPAVYSVSRGIEQFWQKISTTLTDQNTFREIAEKDGKYVSNPTSFGRLPVASPSPSEVNQFKAKIQLWLNHMKSPDLPRIMNLHDTFLKVFCRFKHPDASPAKLAASSDSERTGTTKQHVAGTTLQRVPTVCLQCRG